MGSSRYICRSVFSLVISPFPRDFGSPSTLFHVYNVQQLQQESRTASPSASIATQVRKEHARSESGRPNSKIAREQRNNQTKSRTAELLKTNEPAPVLIREWLIRYSKNCKFAILFPKKFKRRLPKIDVLFFGLSR